MRLHGPNQLDAAPEIPVWRKFLRQFADPLVYLLLAAIVISVVAWLFEREDGIPFEAIVIAAIVILNAVLGHIQEARAERAVAALQRMAAPMAGVIRGGKEQRIAAANVVPGDVLLLEEGDAVCADARLVETSSLKVAEASLTGESESVLKATDALTGATALGDRVNMVFNGTNVVRGRGRAVVYATGMATEMGKVAQLLSDTKDEKTPLQQEIARVGRLLGIAVVVIAAVVMTTLALTSDIQRAADVVTILLIGVSLAVAAVPEGLPAILSVVLALGVQRMARKKAIVKNLSSVETLGSSSVICTDKTGTLTKSEMTIQRVVTPSLEAGLTGSGYHTEGELEVEGDPLDDPKLLEEIQFVLAAGSLANNAVLREDGEELTIQGDPTEIAFLVAEAKLPGLSELREKRFERVGEVPFTSERKLMSTLEADIEHEGRISVVTKGAPDILLERCTQERVKGEVIPLTKDRTAAILEDVERLAEEAYRTLAVAYRSLPPDEEPSEHDSMENELIYLGMVGIIDPPRSEAREAVAEAMSAQVRVVMITGDHPSTAARIARDLGIAETGAPVVTGREIEESDEEALTATMRTTSVCARVAPEHKLRIIDALQRDGNIVAMTGDGVNDAPALKSADIGVAMGITGTDVAKEASDVILADDNFATIVSAIKQGRGIFLNIRKFLRFLLSSNIGEVLTMFFGALMAGIIGLKSGAEAVAVPLLATQILWINLLTDSAPALAMGFDPTPPDIMKRPPRRLNDRMIDARMWRGIFWIGILMAIVTLAAFDLGAEGGVLGGSGGLPHGRTLAFTTLVFAQLFNCFNARSESRSAFRQLFTNKILWGSIALSAGLQVLVVQTPGLNHAFGTTPLGIADWMICLGLASIVLWADEIKKLAVLGIHALRARSREDKS